MSSQRHSVNAFSPDHGCRSLSCFHCTDYSLPVVLSEDDFLLEKDKLIHLKLTVFFTLSRSWAIFQKFEDKSVENTVEPLGTDTSLLQTVSNVPTKFSYIFFKKSLIRTTDTKSRPQRVNLYKLCLLTTDTAVIT